MKNIEIKLLALVHGELVAEDTKALLALIESDQVVKMQYEELLEAHVIMEAASAPEESWQMEEGKRDALLKRLRGEEDEDAEPSVTSPKPATRVAIPWQSVSAVAACLVGTVVVGTLLMPKHMSPLAVLSDKGVVMSDSIPETIVSYSSESKSPLDEAVAYEGDDDGIYSFGATLGRNERSIGIVKNDNKAMDAGDASFGGGGYVMGIKKGGYSEAPATPKSVLSRTLSGGSNSKSPVIASNSRNFREMPMLDELEEKVEVWKTMEKVPSKGGPSTSEVIASSKPSSFSVPVPEILTNSLTPYFGEADGFGDGFGDGLGNLGRDELAKLDVSKDKRMVLKPGEKDGKVISPYGTEIPTLKTGSGAFMGSRFNHGVSENIDYPFADHLEERGRAVKESDIVSFGEKASNEEIELKFIKTRQTDGRKGAGQMTPAEGRLEKVLEAKALKFKPFHSVKKEPVDQPLQIIDEGLMPGESLDDIQTQQDFPKGRVSSDLVAETSKYAWWIADEGKKTDLVNLNASTAYLFQIGKTGDIRRDYSVLHELVKGEPKIMNGGVGYGYNYTKSNLWNTQLAFDAIRASDKFKKDVEMPGSGGIGGTTEWSEAARRNEMDTRVRAFTEVDRAWEIDPRQTAEVSQKNDIDKIKELQDSWDKIKTGFHSQSDEEEVGFIKRVFSSAKEKQNIANKTKVLEQQRKVLKDINLKKENQKLEEKSKGGETHEVKNLNDETTAQSEPFSTFSLHVSDVSFKLAKSALLEHGSYPDKNKIRPEEFVNAFDYGDTSVKGGAKVACNMEQALHPFMQQRNLMRVSMSTAAVGRSQPLRLTLLLDNSGSMERADREASVIKAIEVLVSQLQPEDEVSLLSFSLNPRIIAEGLKGAQLKQLVRLVKQAPSEGGTNMEKALQLAGAVAKRNKKEGTMSRIVLLTDGAANLGNADPNDLSESIVALRQQGIAFDACGVGADKLDDNMLETLARKGDGRYYLLDKAEDADSGFVKQLAGALRPAASNVKVQVKFNPKRVKHYKLLGFEKHLLKKEDFRNDKVDAAEMAAQEAGSAMYQFEPMSNGSGDVGEVFVRFRDMTSGEMVERSWAIPYQPQPLAVVAAKPSMQLASTAAMLAEKVRGSDVGLVDFSDWGQVLGSLGDNYANDARVQDLIQMVRKVARD